ncbi:MAG: hypothetical protein AB1733_08195 [Thermodesulfobacteriota bacterium]
MQQPVEHGGKRPVKVQPALFGDIANARTFTEPETTAWKHLPSPAIVLTIIQEFF